MTKTRRNAPDVARRLGYARLSTYGQTLDAQLEQLRADGCAKIYRETVSGARADRRELLRLLRAVAPGDMVTVTRIDRLARSTFDLFAIVKQIVDAGGQFRSMAEPWADTATNTGLMIAILGGLADMERDLIRTRTTEERSRAKARGQHMGRRPKLTDAQKAEARRGRYAEGAGAELCRGAGHDFAAHSISRGFQPLIYACRGLVENRLSAAAPTVCSDGRCGRQIEAVRE